jgi:hypothetical protein
MQIPSVEKTPIPKPTPYSNIERSIQTASEWFEKSSERLEKSLKESRAQVSAALHAAMVELEKDTELIPITLIRNGHTLRTMLEHGVHFTEEFGDHTPAAREAFAKLADYLDDYRNIANDKACPISTRAKFDDFIKDYRNIAHEYSATERIRIDADLDALLARIAEQHCVVGAGLQRAEIEYERENIGPQRYEIVHIVLAPEALSRPRFAL